MKHFFILLLLLIFTSCAPVAEQNSAAVSGDAAPVRSLNDDANSGGRFAQAPEVQKQDSWQDQPARAEERSQDSSVPSQINGVEKNAPALDAREPARAESKSRAMVNEADAAPLSSGSGGGGISSPSLRPIPKPEPERPGLATSWGETRYSSVSEVPFERDDTRPNYSASLFYNDERGARVLAEGGAFATAATVNLGSALTLSLRDEYGSTLSAYRGNRTVAIGQSGQRYVLMVRNHTNERFEVVLSVDGLDVLDGRDAAYNKRGYLIEAYGILEIEGFRQSSEAIAAFRFGSVRDSYAAKTGSARNVGVIGAAAFAERGYAARLRAYQERIYVQRMNGIEIQRRESADPFPTKYAVPPLRLAR